MATPAPRSPAGNGDDAGIRQALLHDGAAPAERRSTPEPVRLQLDAGTALAVRVDDADELPHALVALGLSEPRPTLVVVGGADGLRSRELQRLRPVVANTLVPIVAAADGAIVDGGTDSGVMRLVGEAAASTPRRVPLVGVAAAATVALPGDPAAGGKAHLEPHHSHFVFVPGETWGDESEWLSLVASALAGPSRSVTVLLNGGATAWRDVESSVAAGRPVIVLDGSGRAADEMAAVLGSVQKDDRGDRLGGSGLMEAVSLDGGAVAEAVRARLANG